MSTYIELFLPFQQLRLLLTPCIFLSKYIGCNGNNGDMSLIILAVLLLLLDIIDCKVVQIIKHIDKKLCSRSNYYQMGDKFIDQIQYGAAIIMVWTWPILNDQQKLILLASWIWRSVGVVIFMKTKNLRVLTVFPDMIKEFLVLWFFIPQSNWIVIVLLIGLKMIFEYAKSKNFKFD